MKFIVRDNPMAWAIVCLIAGLIAELTGPGIGAAHLIALGVGAIAFVMILWPDRPRHWRGIRRVGSS
jgi:hypothetical protein